MDQLIHNTEKIFDNIKIQLSEGVKNRQHGFHTPIFSNLKKDGRTSSRMVVLRKFDSSKMKINFHSDIRSKKIQEVKLKPETNFLFYDPKIKIQLRLTTFSTVHHNDNVTLMAWNQTQLLSRKCYLTESAPSSLSKIATDGLPKHLQGTDPSRNESEKGYINFSVISNRIKQIEWLYLSSAGHRRLLININSKKQIYNWLIP